MVDTYQLGVFLGKQIELPLFGQVTNESFIHQGTLRAPAQLEDYRVISRAELFRIPAIVQYIKTKPNVVLISGKGIVGEQRIYKRRIQLRDLPYIGQIVKAEVLALPSERAELETEFQNVSYTYY